MKSVIVLFILLVCAFCAFAFEVRDIPLADVTAIAMRNAKEQWGDVYADNPIPLYDADDKLVAWQFNFSLGKLFPTKDQLLERIVSEGPSLYDAAWNTAEFANMVLGARSDQPVIVGFSQGLSEEYFNYNLIDKLVKERFSSNYKILKEIFVGFGWRWSVVQANDEIRYVKALPPYEVCSKEEFLALTNNEYYFAKNIDYSEEWTSYMGGNTQGREYIYVQNHDLMPFLRWSYGCSPTSGAMIVTYYDYDSINREGDFSNTVNYYQQRYEPITEETCYHLPNTLYDIQDRMYTETVIWGMTLPFMMDEGMESFYHSRGHNYWGGCYSWHWDYFFSNSDMFYDFRSEINWDHPALLNTWNHTICAMGYSASSHSVALHDSNWSSLRYWNISNFYYLVKVHPRPKDGASIDITQPDGGHGFTSNGGDAETLQQNQIYEIRWTGDLLPDTHVEIYYSTQMTSPWSNRVPITMNATNIGYYPWKVPSDLQSENVRIMMRVADSNNQVLGSDGSYGHFSVTTGGSIPALITYVAVTVPSDVTYYTAPTNSSAWAAIGLWKDTNTEGELVLYDSNFNTRYCRSTSSQNTNWVVLDRNHSPDTSVGVRARLSDYTANNLIEVEGGTHELLPGVSGIMTWDAGDIVRIWDVPLNPGFYSISLQHMTGFGDFGIALYGSDTGSLYHTRGTAKGYSDASSSLGWETFSVYIDTSDRYGLLIWANSRTTSGEYRVYIAGEGMWLGATSTNWNTGSNWSFGSVPTSTTDVQIPETAIRMPAISGGINAYCREISIGPDARLDMGQGTLNVSGSMLVSGTFKALGNSTVNVSNHVSWRSNSQYEEIGVCLWNVTGNWSINSGTQMVLSNALLTFKGNGDSNITVQAANVNLCNLVANKNSGYELKICDTSDQALWVNGFIVNSGSVFRHASSQTFHVHDNLLSYGGIRFDAGTIRFDGTGIQNLSCHPNDVFKRLDIFGSGQVNLLSSSMNIQGSVYLYNGTFNLGTNTLIVAGDWNSLGGILANTDYLIKFTGGANSQVFQLNANKLELAKSSSAELIVVSGGSVTCNSYDWTSGSLRVLDGATFTANDLADIRIMGRFYLENGQIDLHQDTNHYIDLDADLFLYSGTMNIWGGYNYPSEWAYTRAVTVMIEDASLNFKDNGIFLQNTGYYLSANISGGTIRTSKDFKVERNGFNPTGGILEMYGSGSAILHVNSPSCLHNVVIDKASSREGENFTGGERINQVTVDANTEFNGYCKVNTGSILQVDNAQLSLTKYLDIYGAIQMDSPNELIQVGASCTWKESSSAVNLTAGSIKCKNSLFFDSGCNVVLPASVTFVFAKEAGGEQNIYMNEPSVVLGTLIDERTGGPLYFNGTCTYNLSGDLIVKTNATINLNDESVNVSGKIDIWDTGSLVISSVVVVNTVNFYESGLLTMIGGTLNISSNYIQYATGVNQITNGSFKINTPYSGAMYSFAGASTVSGGVFQITNNGIQFGADSNFLINQNGCLQLGWSFRAPSPNTFSMTSGEVIMIGDRSATIELASGNNIYCLTINKEASTNTVYMMSDVTLLSSLSMMRGKLYLNHHILDVSYGVAFLSGSTLNAGYSDDELRVGSSWYNESAPGSFVHGSGTVKFYSNRDAQISDTITFNNLVIDKATTGTQALSIATGKTVTVSGNLDVVSGSLKLRATSHLNVTGNLSLCAGSTLECLSGEANMQIQISGTTTIAYTASLLLGSSVNNVFTGNMVVSGVLNLYNSYNVLHGYLTANTTSEISIHNGYLTCDAPDNSQWQYMRGTLNMGSELGCLEFTNLSLQFVTGCTNNITGGKITTGRAFYAQSSGVFQPSAGTVEFIGNQSSAITCDNGNWFANIRIAKTNASVILSTDLNIKGDIIIASGVLNPVSYNINCGRNWNNYVGNSGFSENNSTVTFTGASYNTQVFIQSSEVFYNLKIDFELRAWDCVLAPGVTVNVLNDLELVVSYIVFSNNSSLIVAGDIRCLTNSIIILGDAENANLTFAGDFNSESTVGTSGIYASSPSATVTLNGSGPQHISITYSNFQLVNLVIDKAIGSSVFINAPLTIENLFNLNSGIWDCNDTEFTHTFQKDFTIGANGVWNDNSGTVRFTGITDSEISVLGTSNFRHIELDKGGSNNRLIMTSDWNTHSNQPVILQNGILDLNGHVFHTDGNLTVTDGAKLKLTANSTLSLVTSQILDIQSGGVFESYGLPGQKALVTNTTGCHEFYVQSGATISAEYTIFEKMGTQGIDIRDGATVDNAHSLNNCEFKYGHMFGTLLTINNNQTLTIENPVFVSSDGALASNYNVAKTNDYGSISISGESGAFADGLYENDPFMRINWSTDAAEIYVDQTELLFGDVTWSTCSEQFLNISNTGTASLIGNISVPEGFLVASYRHFNGKGFTQSSDKDDPALDNRNTINFLIPPLSEATYSVWFYPAEPIEYDGYLLISHNAVGGTCSVHLNGQGTGPMGIIDPPYLIYELSSGTTASQTLTLSNCGTDSLSYYAYVLYPARSRNTIMSEGFEGNISTGVVSKSTTTPVNDWVAINDSTSASGYILPGDPAEVFNINVDAADLTDGNYNAQIFVYTNDPVNWDTVIPVDIHVGSPGINIVESYLAFGNVIAGTDSTLYFTVESTGGVGLNGTITTPQNFSVVRSYDLHRTAHHSLGTSGRNPGRNTIEFSLLAGEIAYFDVTFTPDAIQSYSGNIVISSNAGADELFSVSGTGVDLPVVTTASVTDIHARTATCGGNVTSDGGMPFLERGICWNTSANPTPDDYHIAEPGSTGAFTIDLTNLNHMTQYYVRAYAENTLGISYGEELSFTTATPYLTVSTDSLPDFGHVPINQHSAEASFTISGENLVDMVMLSVLAESGFELSTTSWDRNTRVVGEPLNLYPDGEILPETTIYVRFSPTQTGFVWEQITPLTVGGNTCDIAVSGTGVTTPSVNISIPYNITQISATIGGLVWDDGLDPISDCGICWSTNESPTIADSHTTEGIQLEWFYSELTGLTPNTTYYARAYATNVAGTAYSSQNMFRTAVNPTVAVSDSVLAHFGSIILNQYSEVDTFRVSGESLVDAVFVSAPTGFQISLSDRDNERTYTSVLTLTPVAGTVPETNIYIRFAPTTGGNLTNSVIVSSQDAVSRAIMVYGMGITTPTVSTAAATEITYNSATSGGTIQADGWDCIITCGVCWSTDPNPNLDNDHTTNSEMEEQFVDYLSDLEPNTTYYIRAYATNNAGIAFGEQLSFTTALGVLDPPQNLRITLAGMDLQLAWDAVDGANSYHVYRSSDPYSTAWGLPFAITANTYWTDTEPAAGRFYRVVASSEPVE